MTRDNFIGPPTFPVWFAAEFDRLMADAFGNSFAALVADSERMFRSIYTVDMAHRGRV